MREMKFRAWDDKRRFMTYSIDWWDLDEFRYHPEGFFCKRIFYHHPTEGRVCIKWPERVMQSIGRHDKNGVEIYEGDVGVNDRGERGIVVFSGGSFLLEYFQPYNWDPMEPVDSASHIVEVLGNIHENPELVGGTT